MIETFDIAGYARISVDDEQDQKNISIENQKAIIEDYVKTHFPGSTLTFFEDRDRSGYTFEQREGYQEMRRGLMSHKYDILIIKDFSRFSRRNSRGLVELEDLRDAGVRIVSIGDGVDFPNDDDWLKIQFQFLVNEMPVTDTSRKVRNVIKRRQNDGEWICAAPYGYLVTEDKQFEIIPTEAETVRRIFDLYSNAGWGYKKIANYLTDQGVPTPRMSERMRKEAAGKKTKREAKNAWAIATVQGILDNDFYIGTLRQVFMQYGKLSQETSRSAQLLSSAQLKGMFILRVMNGRYASQEENDHICEHLGLSFPYGRFCACVMLLDRAPVTEEFSRLEPVLADLSGDGFTACFCQADDRCSALGVINFAQDNQLPAIGQQIMNRLREANPQFPAPTLAMGHGYEDMQHIPVSYIEARAALDYRLVFGTHTVILYDYLRVSEANEGAYPRHLLDAFTRGLLNWDVEAISRELSKLTQYIRETPMSLQQVKCVCMEISTAFMREAHHISTAHPFNEESFDVFHICEYASIDELAGHITELSVAMQRYLQSTENLCQDNDIQRCLMIMDQNIANCQFSLEALSDQFSITPQTLRRRFKNATGKTMNDYMTSLRLDQAKRLLQDTQLELADICAQCGYNDLSSFIRLFKSKTGETPGRYREIHRTW